MPFKLAFPRRGKKSAEAPRLRPWVLAYWILGERIRPLLPHFEGLRESLLRAKLGISFEAYVSLLVLVTAAGFSIPLPVTTIVLLSMGFDPLFSVACGFGVAFLCALIAFLALYLYPSAVASSLASSIDRSLPFGASYIAIFTDAGIPPDRIFRSLAGLEGIPGLDKEATFITRDVSLLGEDILTAMKRAAEHSPSPLLSDLLDGYVTTVRSGGDVTSYVTGKARDMLELRRLRLRRFVDSLAFVAEIFVALIVTAPLVFLVLLMVMSTVGGAIMGLSPADLLRMLAYVFVPIGSALVLAWIHLMAPKD